MAVKLAWGAKVLPDFRQKVLRICTEFEWTDDHASWLMACIAFETGETFSPAVLNRAGSGAVGLIQFMPQTAVSLGTTSEALSRMTAVEQLDYVAGYFRINTRYKRIASLSDMYTAIFAPKYIGYSEDTVLYSEGAAYRLNAPLDKNNDGKITKMEASSLVQVKLVRGLQYGYWTEELAVKSGLETIPDIVARIRNDLNIIEAMVV